MTPRARRLRTIAMSVLGAVALYGVIGGLVAPPIARHVLETQLRERLGRPVAVEKVRINPYTLQVSVKGLRVLEPDGKTAFVSFDELDADGSAASAWRLAPVIDELTLSGLHLRIVRTRDSRYNASDILERLARAAQAKAKQGGKEDPARFSVENIRVVGATIDFDDQPLGVKHQVAQVQLAIPFISNLPTHLKDQVQPSFFANVNGAPVKLTGEALPFENTVRTNFNLDLQAVDLPRYLGYLPAGLPVKLDSGRLDARIALRFTQAAGLDPVIDIAGTAALGGVALSGAQGPLGRFERLEADIASLRPLRGLVKLDAVRLTGVAAMQDQWKIAAVEARDVDVDAAKRTLRVGAVTTADGAIALKRNADGSVEIPRVAASPEPTPDKWDMALASLRLTGYTVTLLDGSVKPAATHRVVVASLEGENLSNDKGASGTANAKLQVGRGGTLEVASSFALEPLAVKAAVEARRIDLVPLRAYVSQFPTVAVKSALASAKGTASITGTGSSMRVAYAGSVELSDLATADFAIKEDLLNWKSVRSNGIKLDYAASGPLQLAVAEVVVDRAYSRIVVTPEGKLNVQQLMGAPQPQKPGAQTPPPAPQSAPAARNIRIDRVTFVDSRLNFTDLFIRPNYNADVQSLQGSVTGLSSEPESRAAVDLQGRWDATAPVLIAGKVNPLRGDLFVDIAAQAQEIDLTKLTAYSQRYAGYGITEGRLTLDVKYLIDNGKLSGRNRIVVDQLAFGDKVESPDATTLPVLFAVKLLKDKNGRIDLQLPVSGSLEDPKFEFGALIAQVVRNMFGMASTSPFTLMASSAGGKEGEAEALAFIEFEPGAAEIPPAGEKKLQTLVKLLQDRPGVKLEVASRLDPVKDVEALKAAALQRKLAAAPKDLSREAREKLEKEPIEVSEAELAALAAKRAEQVKAWLVAAERLPADRVTVAAVPAKAAEGSKARLSRVDFALR